MSIAMQIYFQVPPAHREDFRRHLLDAYMPALERQSGYRRAEVLALYDEATSHQIGAVPTQHNFVLSFEFDSEADRRRWADSDLHAKVWAKAQDLSDSVDYQGYEVLTH